MGMFDPKKRKIVTAEFAEVLVAAMVIATILSILV